MSISSNVRKAGPYTGNGTTTDFPFSFKVFQTSEVVVVQTDTTGTETTLALTADYTISLNADQDANPGGTATLLAAPATGVLITLTSSVAITQGTTLTNQGGFYPAVINDALDKLTIVAQEASEKQARALNMPLSDSTPPSDLPSAANRSGKYLTFDTSGNPTVTESAVGTIPTSVVGNLTTLRAASIADGDIVQLVAHTTAGDGGDGVFRAVTGAAAGTYTDNNGTIIVPTGGDGSAAWLREYSGAVSVDWFGADNTGSVDSYASIMAAYNFVAAKGGGIVSFAPNMHYIISGKLVFTASNINYIGNGCTIESTVASAGHFSDGMQIGNSDLADGEGGTNVGPFTYTTNFSVKGFRFYHCRAALRIVRAKNFIVDDIASDGVATVSIGNDASSNCYFFSVKAITQTGWTLGMNGEEWYVAGFYSCQYFTVDGVQNLAPMTVTTNASCLELKNSDHWSASGLKFDQSTKFANGITITGSTYFTLTDWRVVNCKAGMVTFPGATVNTVGVISNGSAVNCAIGVQPYTQHAIFRDIYTVGCTTDLQLMTDAAKNLFDSCQFNPLGTAVISEQTSGGNNGINLQKWNNCKTGNTLLGIEGTTSGYFGNNKPAFYANTIANIPNATGDGTFVSISSFTISVYDNHSDFNPTTGFFTVPIDGMYEFKASVGMVGTTSGGVLYLSISGTLVYVDSFSGVSDNVDGVITLPLIRGNTVQLQVVAYGGAKTVTVGTYAAQTSFRGRLVG